MGPLLMNVLLVSFPRERRGAIMGVFGLVMITAPAIGPTLSGYIVQYHDWRMLFEMIIPFAVISLVLAIWKLQNVMETRKTHLDYTSVVFSALGFGGLLYGVSSVSISGWSDPLVISTSVIGIIFLILFVWRQFRLDIPLLDFRVYKYPMFALSSIISIINAAAMFSGMILTPAYVQDVRGITPLDSGLLMLPGAIIMGVMSPITGKLFDKFGPRTLSLVGLGITALTTYMLADLQLDSSYSYIMFLYSMRMFGMSMVMMPIMTNGLNQLPTRLNPHGTAINNTTQQVAGSIGTAIFITIMNSRMKTSMQEMVGAAPPSSIDGEQLALIGQKSLLAGIQFSFFIATFVTIAAFVLAFFLKRVDVSPEAVAKLEKEHSPS